jgi:hypothetical protein
MLTQFQTTRVQAAFLAACPRPRVLVGSTAPVASWPLSGSASVPAGSTLPGSDSGSKPAVRPIAAERPAFGYALRGAEKAGLGAVEMRRTDARARFAEPQQDQRNQQDQLNHLIRRESRTWRPPH